LAYYFSYTLENFAAEPTTEPESFVLQGIGVYFKFPGNYQVLEERFTAKKTAMRSIRKNK
jgi:hypothetical protein